MYLLLMRRFFVILLIMVFVGGHSLSDVAAHLQGNADNADSSAISKSADMAFLWATAMAPAGAATKVSGSKAKLVSTSDSLHCATYSGLMAAQNIGVYPDTKSDLYLQYFLTNTSIPISGHFRPPIA